MTKTQLIYLITLLGCDVFVLEIEKILFDLFIYVSRRSLAFASKQFTFEMT
jgi:hypothetical protein